MHVAWVVYGDVDQPTGGYVYDRLVIGALRAGGDRVTMVDPPEELPKAGLDAVVGDGLCVRELGPAFEAIHGGPYRVLLVHHMPSWELERTDRAAMAALEARAVRASDRVVVTSATTGARLVAEYPGLAVDIVPPGADRLARLPRVPKPEGDVEVAFVGSLVRRKRLDLLFDALESVPPPRPALVLAGDASREPEHAEALLARVARSPVLRGRVTHLGVLGERALAERLARADALVLPSSLEGYGMVIAEALHAAVPVLAARAAAIAAGADALAAVRVFDDAAGLAGLLARLAGDAAWRASLLGSAAELADSVPGSPGPLHAWSEAGQCFRAVLAGGRRP